MAVAQAEALDVRDVEVAEDGERGVRGDGRRGHHEGVRRGGRVVCLLAERGALVEAGAVPLVVGRDGEIGEAGEVGEQGVRADDDVGVARFDARERGLAVFLRLRAGEQFDTDRAALEQRGDVEVVLLGQDLGGRRDGGLRVRGHGHEHRVERDHGLAGADVALDQPVRGRGPLEVLGDLSHGGVLPGREGEGDALADVRVDAFAPLERGRAGLAALPGAAQLHRQLQHEEFVVGEAPARDEDLFPVRRAVHHPVRVGERGELVLAPERIGEVVLDERKRVRENLLDRALDRAGFDGFARRVDGSEAIAGGADGLGFDLVVGHALPAGVDQLDAVGAHRVRARLALHADAHARVDGLDEVGAVEPDEVEAPGLVGEDRLEAGLASADDAGRGDFAPRGDDPSRLKVGEFVFAGLEFVAEGEVGDELADVPDAQRVQGLRAPRADAGDRGDGRAERDVGSGRHRRTKIAGSAERRPA